MDLTPPEEAKLPYSHSSTPLTHLPPNRKRKHDDTFDFPTSPKFSSTLNESLITALQDKCLLGSLPGTPEKQRNILARTVVVSSPIQESWRILYGSLKEVKPERDRRVRNCFVSNNTRTLFDSILRNNVIMKVFFKYLSDGDLYRFSQVCKSAYKAVEGNRDAFERYRVYKRRYKNNKENYVITPPGSPAKCDSPPRTSDENFNKILRVARGLTRSQSLNKCRKCGHVTVVENEVAQCQNVNSCGLIYCLLCSSYSETGAKDFRDSCGHATLRTTLGNMSNHMDESYFNFSSQDSGFYSESESPPKVRRNLFTSTTETPKALSVCNKNRVVVTYKKKEAISCVPVLLNREQSRRQLDCDSPPRYSYAVGSKQSKKNLKRLTR